MNPFSVAQKTHFVNGAIGYEAQLVNAVICNSGMVDGSFHYEYRDEGGALECRPPDVGIGSECSQSVSVGFRRVD